MDALRGCAPRHLETVRQFHAGVSIQSGCSFVGIVHGPSATMERTMKTLTADRAVTAERALNTAIVNADITRGFEEYLALVDQYYAEDVEVSADTSPEPVVGRDRLKSILFSFLAPLHMMAEIGGLWV